MDLTTVLIVVIVVLVIALVAGGVLLSRARASQRLRERYGPEYERTLRETGDRRTTESELAERERRHDALDLRDLRPEERERFTSSWAAIQRGFVDDPDGAVRQADGLVVEILRVRGFPADEAERRTEHLSVEHPAVIDDYRRARATRAASEAGAADTEQQRDAVTAYRKLVAALLGTDDDRRTHRKEQTS